MCLCSCPPTLAQSAITTKKSALWAYHNCFWTILSMSMHLNFSSMCKHNLIYGQVVFQTCICKPAVCFYGKHILSWVHVREVSWKNSFFPQVSGHGRRPIEQVFKKVKLSRSTLLEQVIWEHGNLGSPSWLVKDVWTHGSPGSGRERESSLLR